MNWNKEWRPLAAMTILFGFCYFLPVEQLGIGGVIAEALLLVRLYAREHVILCLLPAFFIAGGISVFISSGSVMKYLGAGANKFVAYAVAAVSGSILAVCSCTVLPLFAGIFKMGAGIGPASAFLYSGPAINVLAVILTGRVLGVELGVARAIGAVVFSVVIGILMSLVFRNGPDKNSDISLAVPDEKPSRPLWQTVIFFGLMIAILVFANWGRPGTDTGFWSGVYDIKWLITSGAAALFGLVLVAWFKIKYWKILAAAVPPAVLALVVPSSPLPAFGVGVVGLSIVAISSGGESREWFSSSWDLAKQIMPLLLAGVLVAGLLLGRPGGEGLIPPSWIASALGGNGLGANLLASVAGAFMYFATLTEVPILEGLIGGGMGSGPALALLLAGPALSLPNMLVIRSVMGTKKTLVFVALVIVMAALSGIIFGLIA